MPESTVIEYLPSITIKTESKATNQVIPSLTRPLPHTTKLPAGLTGLPTKRFVVMKTKNVTSGVTAHDSDVVFFNLNKVTITIIGVVILALVTAVTITSVCLIACRVKKRQKHHIPKSPSLPIATDDNVAYAEPKQVMRMCMKKNQAYADLHPVNPVHDYENLE